MRLRMLLFLLLRALTGDCTHTHEQTGQPCMLQMTTNNHLDAALGEQALDAAHDAACLAAQRFDQRLHARWKIQINLHHK